MKPTKIAVLPARPGMKLRHPVSDLLPDTGRRWIDDAFTQRRLADGGIVLAPIDMPDEAPTAADEAQAVPAANVPPPAPVPAPVKPTAEK